MKKNIVKKDINSESDDGITTSEESEEDFDQKEYTRKKAF